jgi:hypothetical protein
MIVGPSLWSSSPKQRPKAFLLEMPVVGEDIRQTTAIQ